MQLTYNLGNKTETIDISSTYYDTLDFVIERIIKNHFGGHVSVKNSQHVFEADGQFKILVAVEQSFYNENSDDYKTHYTNGLEFSVLLENPHSIETACIPAWGLYPKFKWNFAPVASSPFNYQSWPKTWLVVEWVTIGFIEKEFKTLASAKTACVNARDCIYAADVLDAIGFMPHIIKKWCNEWNGATVYENLEF